MFPLSLDFRRLLVFVVIGYTLGVCGSKYRVGSNNNSDIGGVCDDSFCCRGKQIQTIYITSLHRTVFVGLHNLLPSPFRGSIQALILYVADRTSLLSF